MDVNHATVFRLVPDYVQHAVDRACGWIGGRDSFGGIAVPPLPGYFGGAMGECGYANSL
jgi:NNP family nitrate/nitrite transporter-like MFS transporter